MVDGRASHALAFAGASLELGALLAGSLLIAYVLGTIPSGYIAGRLLANVDIRRTGSGRTGATNALRALGWRVGAVVFAADVAKGAAAVWVGHTLIGTPQADALCAAACIVGHNWPIYLAWRGGRGVSPAFGSFLVIAPSAALLCFAISAAIVWSTRYVSLGSVLGSLLSAIVLGSLAFVGSISPWYGILGLFGAAVILLQHRDNIERLMSGTERRLGDPP